MIKDHSAGGQKFSVTSLLQLADSLKLLTFLSLAESSMRKTFKLYNIHNFVIDQASRQEMKWEGGVFCKKCPTQPTHPHCLRACRYTEAMISHPFYKQLL